MTVPVRRRDNNSIIGLTGLGTGGFSRRETIAWIIVLFQFFFIAMMTNRQEQVSSFLRKSNTNMEDGSSNDGNHLKQVWHGGTPDAPHIRGTCWCSAQDEYCMCNPSLAIDVVLTSYKSTSDDNDNLELWLVQRNDTNQYAFMGGFVKVGESAEDAVIREMKEETGLEITKDSLQLIGFYSDPHRDTRRHTASAVYVVNIPYDSKLKANDDVKQVKRFPYKEVKRFSSNLFADHQSILNDFLMLRQYSKQPHSQQNQHPVHLVSPRERTICAKIGPS